MLLEDLGCFGIVLRKNSIKTWLNKVAKNINNSNVIGIGAGNKVDGQVLVLA